MKQYWAELPMTIISCFLLLSSLAQQPAKPRFKALVLYENGGHHIAYSTEAKVWLNQLAIDSNFAIQYLTGTDSITENFLKPYQLFIQLDYVPYAWKDSAVKAFEQYIEKGRGGWIGFHHATLLGEFDGYKMWQWFSGFMGGIQFKNYIPDFADGTVQIEDTLNPIMKGLPHNFTINKEEWYTYDKSPRQNVHVIARVSEAGYNPPSKVTMGDHPVVWTNLKYPAKNVYIFMGHSPKLFKDVNYTTLFRNAIFWAADKNENARK